MSNFQSIKGCFGAYSALAIIENMPEKGQHFVVCDSEESAKAMNSDLLAFQARSVIFVPDTETLPYDLENPHCNIRSRRNRILSKLSEGKVDGRLIVCSISTLNRKVSSPDFWENNRFELSLGRATAPENLQGFLEHNAYEREELDLSEPGNYVRNSGVFDIFPIGMDNPIRVDIEDGKISRLHTIDIETNRNVSKLDFAVLMPAYEFPTDDRALRRVRGFIRSNTTINPMDDPVFHELKESRHASGLEYFIPELSESTSTIYDICRTRDSHWFFVDNEPGDDAYWLQANRRYQEVTGDMNRVVPEPSQVWSRPDELLKSIDLKKSTILYSSLPPGCVPESTEIEAERQPNLSKTAEMIATISSKSKRLAVVVSNESRIPQVEQLMLLAGIECERFHGDRWWNEAPGKAKILLGRLSKGFKTKDGLSVISDREIFGNVVSGSDSMLSRTIDFQKMQDLESLRDGDPLVHLEYGVGRFSGLETMDMGGQKEEMLKIRYAEDVTGFVPMNELYMVTRFGGLDANKIPLDIMASKKWRRNLLLSVADIEQTALHLVEMKDRRKNSLGKKFKNPGWKYHKFCNGFEFEPTTDQHKAFADVIQDLCRPQPMDRLIVGDVGFGKTEVALRAAFHAIENGESVVVAAPTSILSSQHYHTFLDRFDEADARVVHLDEVSKKDLENTLDGDVPVILIGTHSALRIKDLFSRFGLFIIDEEHRFGTNDKELISTLHGSVNILNMTATPIPRTLTLSLSGIRDISIIATPPSKRLSVRTLMARPQDSTYREAIERELIRSGQVYVLHNRTQTLEERADYIRIIAPKARVKTIHGKMGDDAQKEILLSFSRHEFDVLVCTTVIEIGIDVPRANTILIEEPERLGLSQLHQIRGRVGRSDRQGYAYIVTEPENTPKTSLKRFKALIRAKRLGDGFLLASHDLEIRGAGELLGEKQSGHIYTIGFSLYSKILMRAVAALKEGKSNLSLLDRDRKIDLNLNSSGYISDEFIEKQALRLTFYKRLASAETLGEIREIESEMEERFGKIPSITDSLISMTKIRLFSRMLGISKAIIEDNKGYMEANSESNREILEAALSDVASDIEKRSMGFRFFHPMGDTKKRFAFMIELMVKLQEAKKNMQTQEA
jgi:transcription-repair coupling factor (superfamily II helicase)